MIHILWKYTGEKITIAVGNLDIWQGIAEIGEL